MVLPLIGSILAPTLLGGTAFAGGLGLTGAGLAGLGAGLGSLAQGDDLETALGTGLTSGLTAGIGSKLLGGMGGAGPTGLPEGVTEATTKGVTKALGQAGATTPTNIIGMELAPETIASQINKAGGLAKGADLTKAIGDVSGMSVAGSNLGAGLLGGTAAGAMQPMEPMKLPGSKAVYKKTSAPNDRGTPIGGDTRKGIEADYGFELPVEDEGLLKLAEGGGGLKALPSADKNPGLRKLPEGVRNKMGYMQEGGITSMIEGGSPDTGKNDKEIIADAVRAITGKSETPQEDLAMFVSKFGESALEDLVDRVRSGQFGANRMRGGEGLQRGAGDGMDDMIPANIDGEQDVLLSNDEFVVPADVVSGIGNGSSDAGAKALYDMMDRVRTARTGMTEQPPDIPQEAMLPV